MQLFFSILYVLFFTAHTTTTIVFFVCLFRAVFVKYSPYSSLTVGLTIAVNSAYGGCPVTEIQNFLARLVPVEESLVGEIYVDLGEYALPFRIVLFITSFGLIYNSYKTWNKALYPINLQNLFLNHNKLVKTNHGI